MFIPYLLSCFTPVVFDTSGFTHVVFDISGFTQVVFDISGFTYVVFDNSGFKHVVFGIIVIYYYMYMLYLTSQGSSTSFGR